MQLKPALSIQSWSKPAENRVLREKPADGFARAGFMKVWTKDVPPGFCFDRNLPKTAQREFFEFANTKATQIDLRFDYFSDLPTQTTQINSVLFCRATKSFGIGQQSN
jgi:hypothetical protein